MPSSVITAQWAMQVMAQLGYTLLQDTSTGRGMHLYYDDRAPGQIVLLDFSRGEMDQEEFLERLAEEGLDRDAVAALLD